MSYATIRSLFETAFANSYHNALVDGGDYQNAVAVCTNVFIGNYRDADVDNGTKSLCSDSPDYNSPEFNPGIADYDNADIFPRSEIRNATTLIYDNVQEAPPDAEHVIPVSYTHLTLPTKRIV